MTGDPGDLAVVNLTPVQATGTGYGWLSSSDQDAAGVSNVNYRVGSIDPNVAVAAIGSDGQVCFHNSPLASIHLVADQIATIAADATSAVTPQRLIDTRTGEPIEFDVAAAFGDVEPEALAVTDNGRVVAAKDAQLLVRERDGSIVPIDLPAGTEVSQSWVGPDEIAVAWGDDRGAEVDLATGEIVSRLTRTDDVWTRSMTQPEQYQKNPGRPHNPLGLDLLLRTATELPIVEGAGGFETVYDEEQQWIIPRPAEFSATVDEIAPLPTGGYLVTLKGSLPETVGPTIYPYALHPDGTVESLAPVDASGTGFDSEPTPDGLTTLQIEEGVATVDHLPLA